MNTRFSSALLQKARAGAVPVIPDFKAKSPKEGDLFKGKDPAETAARLARLGVPAFSVVTRGAHFGGSLQLLCTVVKATGRPVLRKDFIKTEDELKETREAGADAVLLICATLSESRLTALFRAALREGLEPLVEACNREELALAARLGAGLCGINNRDIVNLELDGGGVERTRALMAFAPKGAVLVSESGIKTPADTRAAITAGAHAVLVGTALWRAEDIGTCYLALCGARGGPV